jgi:tRNA A-37 threonylcarbamoyl transferase component Bud32
MNTDDHPGQGDAESPCDPALAEALHRALERDARGEPAGVDDLLPPGAEGGERLAGALQVAGLLDQFVRHVEEEAGIDFPAPTEGSTQAYEPGPEALPQPFPGEYRFRALLGEGSFGTVWLADDLRLGVPVALKAVRLEGGLERRSRALAQLENEAKKLARLRHPNVVRVYTWRQAGAEHYLVMQFVPGGSLRARLAAEGPLPWRLAARYIADAAEALGHVHAAGIVHRDIKPANLLWDQASDEVLLTDFGLSAWLAEGGSEAAGTALYMAPEALEGCGGLAADIYGLAATLFHLITGQPPFAAATPQELPARIARGLSNPDPRCESMPAGLERVIRAALAADPARRPALAEFTAALRGGLNQLLADALLPPPGAAAGPALRLTVARRGADGGFTPLAAARRELPRLTRNLELVPPEPEGVVLHTGDRVRIEASADHDGYLTVFNVGPTGDLTLLYPARQGAPPAVPGNQPVVIGEVLVKPPAGCERVFAVWSRVPLPLSLAEVARQTAGQAPVSAAYRATRNLVLVEESVKGVAEGEWRAAVVELEHRAG